MHLIELIDTLLAVAVSIGIWKLMEWRRAARLSRVLLEAAEGWESEVRQARKHE